MYMVVSLPSKFPLSFSTLWKRFSKTQGFMLSFETVRDTVAFIQRRTSSYSSCIFSQKYPLEAFFKALLIGIRRALMLFRFSGSLDGLIFPIKRASNCFFLNLNGFSGIGGSSMSTASSKIC